MMVCKESDNSNHNISQHFELFSQGQKQTNCDEFDWDPSLKSDAFVKP